MTIFDEMVAAYNPQNAEQRLNAQHQAMQQIVMLLGVVVIMIMRQSQMV